MLVRLTAPNGSPVLIDPTTIKEVRANNGDYHPNAKTVIVTEVGAQAVKETFEQVEKMVTR